MAEMPSYHHREPTVRHVDSKKQNGEVLENWCVLYFFVPALLQISFPSCSLSTFCSLMPKCWFACALPGDNNHHEDRGFTAEQAMADNSDRTVASGTGDGGVDDESDEHENYNDVGADYGVW